jgi:hypothetical protein
MKETPNKTVSRTKSAKHALSNVEGDAKVDFDKKKLERVGPLRA